jgi:hypothetical protein
MTPDALSSWDWLPILFWPAALSFLLLCTLIFMRAAPSSMTRVFVTSVLVFSVPFIVRYLLLNSSQSLAHLFDFYFGFVAIGALYCIGFVLVYFSALPVASRMGVLCIAGLAGPASLFFGLNVLIQDHALARPAVEGTISRLNAATWAKRAPEYQVTIETRRFWATPATFETLHVGDRVRAEIGKGSLYIYRIERVPKSG